MSKPFLALTGFVYLITAASPVLAQPHRVDARLSYERLWCVVPLIGTGTLADPKRPMYAPAPGAMNVATRTGIIGFTFVLSDNQKFALVEFVARDRSAFRSILADVAINATSKAFLKGQHKREDVEAEFKKQKKDFDFNSFGVRMP